jgi:arginase
MDLTLLLVPYDLGRKNFGQGAGPDALLNAGARKLLTDAGHRVRGVQRVSLPTDRRNEIGNTFALAGVLALRVRKVREEGAVPVVLAGSCSSAIGVMSGLTAEAGTGLVWFDAHGDANTPETSESGYFDGMPLAVLVGWCWTAMARRVPGFVPVPEEMVLHVGGRDFDPQERKALYSSGIGILDADALRRTDGRGQLASALKGSAKRWSGIDLHLDLDIIDPSEGTANRFAAPGGPPLEEIEAAIRSIGQAFQMRAITVCSYDPNLDRDQRALHASLRLLGALANALGQ